MLLNVNTCSNVLFVEVIDSNVNINEGKNVHDNNLNIQLKEWQEKRKPFRY